MAERWRMANLGGSAWGIAAGLGVLIGTCCCQQAVNDSESGTSGSSTSTGGSTTGASSSSGGTAGTSGTSAGSSASSASGTSSSTSSTGASATSGSSGTSSGGCCPVGTVSIAGDPAFVPQSAGFTPVFLDSPGGPILETVSIYVTNIANFTCGGTPGTGSAGFLLELSPLANQTTYTGLVGTQPATGGYVLYTPAGTTEGLLAEGTVTVTAANATEISGSFDASYTIPHTSLSQAISGTFSVPNCPGLTTCDITGC